MKNVHCLVLLYGATGEFTAEMAAQVAQYMCNNGVVEKIDEMVIKDFDTEAIAKALLGAASIDMMNDEPSARIIHFEKPVSSEEDIKNEAMSKAIEYIGTFFAESLAIGKETNNYSKFALELAMRVEDDHTAQAIEIIAKGIGKPSRHTLSKFRITPGAREVIRDIYGSHPRFH